MNTGLPTVPLLEHTAVSATRGELLANLGLYTTADLLLYAPIRYEDHRPRSSPDQFQDGETVVLRGMVTRACSLRWFGKKRCRLATYLQVDGETTSPSLQVGAVWFNQPYLQKRLVKGKQVQVVGRWDATWKQVNVQQTTVDPGSLPREGEALVPVYSVTQKIPLPWLRNLVKEIVDTYSGSIPETLPQSLRERYHLLSRAEAIRGLHQPATWNVVKQARRRLAYEELLLYQLRLLARRAKRLAQPGIARTWSSQQLTDFYGSLPWSFTDAQQQAAEEILASLQSPRPMHRLLQGDVGTGKTVVAALALYANAIGGYQGACMVPTEILVSQHYTALTQWLVPLGIRILPLHGRMTARVKREALGRIADGTANVVVGTHALIQEQVKFSRLGLIITDEQHRFGVRQRAALYAKGTYPDVLCMTATPIPRTLTLTSFGEQEVSSLRDRPRGRKPITTHWVRPNKWSQVIKELQIVCAQGTQAYVVCPRIEALEEGDQHHAESRYEALSKQLAPYKVGLLHSRLDPWVKEQVMQDFAANRLQVLVATTVVEVGVDVPNATLMVIEAADHFGLAQLHQLRGRVGRGTHASSCILVADPATEIGVERMKILCQTQDGFAIAERDLELRGPGEFLGVRQSGIPHFLFADLQRDQRMLEVARKDAAELLEQFGSPSAWCKIQDPVNRRFAQVALAEGEEIRSV